MSSFEQSFPGEPDDDRMPIRLMHWDSRWRQEFEQTRSSILQCGEGRIVDVQHVGATAVPGMIARPIIDFVAIVGDPVDLKDSCFLIEGLNFLPVPLPDWAEPQSGITRTLQKPRRGEPTHFAWVTTQGSPVAAEMLRFRNQLRDDSSLAMQFESDKVDCWKQCGGDENRYLSGMQQLFEDNR